MKILVLIIISITLGIASLKAQSVPLTGEEKQRVQLLRSFCQYVQQTPWEQLDDQQLQQFISLSDSSRVKGSRPWRFYQAALQAMDQLLDGKDLAEYDAVPWYKFPDQNKLPKMVWEAEPITELMGQPLPARNREAELTHGRRTLDNTLVIVKKSDPHLPLYYALFDEQTGKIASWMLINQGGLHYFWLL